MSRFIVYKNAVLDQIGIYDQKEKRHAPFKLSMFPNDNFQGTLKKIEADNDAYIMWSNGKPKGNWEELKP